MADRKKNASSQVTELKATEKAQPDKGAKSAPAKDERRAPKTTQKRDAKGTSLFARMRNTKIGRFIYDAYYELRYKVTWPTFQEARNMTIMVLVLSAVLGGILSLADLGLYRLFLLIIGGN